VRLLLGGPPLGERTGRWTDAAMSSSVRSWPDAAFDLIPGWAYFFGAIGALRSWLDVVVVRLLVVMWLV
jgi:hypothetical protein